MFYLLHYADVMLSYNAVIIGKSLKITSARCHLSACVCSEFAVSLFVFEVLFFFVVCLKC